jgi:succinate-semialdehyde dehydrogenase/glutarate-semialdehyde dehydrogenase
MIPVRTIYANDSFINIDEFVDGLTKRAEHVEMNYPDIHQGHIGPLIFDRQAEIILDHLDDAVNKVATILCGGKLENHGDGKWIRPTVLTEVDHSMKVMREETFGPVIPVMAYDNIEAAIKLANDSEYGLSAAVFGQDIEQAKAVASRINAGAIGINDGAVTVDVQDAAHDSFGYSGMGQARMGLTGMTRFTREKALIVRRNAKRRVLKAWMNACCRRCANGANSEPGGPKKSRTRFRLTSGKSPWLVSRVLECKTVNS